MLPLLAALLLLPAVSAGYESMPAPPEAKAWLGHWKTNQGDFGFASITGCYKGPDLVAPTCGIQGSWDRPGSGGSVPIHGTVYLGPKYDGEVFQGCFDLPDLTPGDHCTFNSGGQISLDRAGNHITHGYWKACGLGANCKNHHPITGAKTGAGGSGGTHRCRAPRSTISSGCAYRVRFGVRVDGFPDAPDESSLPTDLATVEFRTRSTKLTWDPAGEEYKATGRIEMTTTYVNQVAGVEERHIEFRVSSLLYDNPLSYTDRDGTRKVRVYADAVKSSDEYCPVGAEIELHLLVKGDKGGVYFQHIGEHKLRCLTSDLIVWRPHKIKKAVILDPEPVSPPA
jgi:hypothetical protein